jgi:hypothetical protein
MLGIPFAAVRPLIAEGQLPATRAGRIGNFMIARTAIAKYAERIKWKKTRGISPALRNPCDLHPHRESSRIPELAGGK